MLSSSTTDEYKHASQYHESKTTVVKDACNPGPKGHKHGTDGNDHYSDYFSGAHVLPNARAQGQPARAAGRLSRWSALLGDTAW